MPKKKKTKKTSAKTAAPKKRGRPKGSKNKATAVAKDAPTAKQIRVRIKKAKADVGVKIVTTSKVKEVLKSTGLRAEKDIEAWIANEVYDMLKKACLRTLRNGRKTVRGWDL